MGGETEYNFQVDISTTQLYNYDLKETVNVQQALSKMSSSGYSLKNYWKGHMTSGHNFIHNITNMCEWNSPDGLPDFSYVEVEFDKELFVSQIANFLSIDRNEMTIIENKADDTSKAYIKESMCISIGRTVFLGDPTRLKNVYYKDGTFYEMYLKLESLVTSYYMSYARPINGLVKSLSVVTRKTRLELKETTEVFKIETIEREKIYKTSILSDFNMITSSDKITNTTTVEDEIGVNEEGEYIISTVDSPFNNSSSIEAKCGTIPYVSANCMVCEFIYQDKYYTFFYISDGKTIYTYNTKISTRDVVGSNGDSSQEEYYSLGDIIGIAQVEYDMPVAYETRASIGTTTPIIKLREIYFGIDEFDIDSKVLDAGDETRTVYRPDNINKDRYENTEYVLSFVGLPLEDILSAISENEGVENISDCFISFGFSFASENKLVAKLAFNSFLYLENKLGLESLNAFGLKVSSYLEDFEYREGSFNQSFSMSSYSRNIVVGSIGEVDTYEIVNSSHEGFEDPIFEDKIRYTTRIRKQITDNTYEEITLHDMSISTVVGAQGWADSKTITPQSENFVFPLIIDVLYDFDIMEMIEIVEECTRLFFYASKLHVTELKWYETGFFKALLDIISIVILTITTIFNPSVGLIGFSAYFASKSVMLILEDSVFRKILLLLINLGAMYAIGGGLSGMFDSFVSTFNTLVSLLEFTTSLINGMTMDKIQNLQDRFEDITEEYESRTTNLEEYFKTMNYDSIMTDFIISLNVQEDLASTNLIVGSDVINASIDSIFLFDLTTSGWYDSDITNYHSNKLQIGF